MREANYCQKILLLLLKITLCVCQEWTWLGGDKESDQLTRGNHPGGRSGSSTLFHNDTVWMFGGHGFTDLSAGKPHVLNDLWSFSISTRSFKLEHPGSWSSIAFPKENKSMDINQHGLFDSLDLQTYSDIRSLVVPAGRQHTALCGLTNKLVVFGGFGERGLALGDMWTYSIGKKEWSEHYNVSTANVTSPSARGHASVWCHNASMYLFGGMSDKKVFNDLWKLDLNSLKWFKLYDSFAIVYNKSNESIDPTYPSARNGAATWISGKLFYMFGGNTDPIFSYTLQRATGLTSDLWSYEPTTSSWWYVTGAMLPGQHSVFNVMTNSFSLNNPGCRIGAATWIDTDGNLWLFGGAGADIHPVSVYHSSKLLSDVWRFHIGTQCWAFMGGSDSGEAHPRYETLGRSTSTGMPGGRTEVISWQGTDNVAFVYGGLGHDGIYYDGNLNDLWCVDVTTTVTREYMISPVTLFVFFGVTFTLLVAVAVLVLYQRQTTLRRGSKGLHFKRSVAYSRIEAEESC